MSLEKGKRLGRGLDALIPGAQASSSAGAPSGGELIRIPLTRIRPNPYQPRREFAESDLADLQSSIAASGLLQPVTVRRVGDGYELISGERRLRATTRLGWTEIPAVVREVDDRTLLTLALIENLQRADLNPIEEARGFKRLIDEFGYTQQQVADAIGKDRTTVTNLLRVLNLPDQVISMVETSKLSLGHARALLPLSADDRSVIAVANEAVSRQYSVRDLEARVRAGSGKQAGKKPEKAPARPVPTTGDARRIEDELRKHLQTDVKVKLSGPDRGTLEVSFYSADDLDRVLELILGAARRDF